MRPHRTRRERIAELIRVWVVFMGFTAVGLAFGVILGAWSLSVALKALKTCAIMITVLCAIFLPFELLGLEERWKKRKARKAYEKSRERERRLIEELLKEKKGDENQPHEDHKRRDLH